MEAVKEMAKKYDPPPIRALEMDQDQTAPAGEEHSSRPLTGTERLRMGQRASRDTPDPLPVTPRVDIEIQRYESLPLEKCRDPLVSWRENKGSFDILKQIAADVLSIPASSASSERAFSAATRACKKERLKMTLRTISNQKMINLNDNDIKSYKATMGISKEYTGVLKKLADVKFPDEMELPTPPPLNFVADAVFEVGDEIYDDSQSESESDDGDTDETDTEEDDY